MNKLFLVILFTPPLFSMHMVPLRLLSRSATPNRFLFFQQKRFISMEEAQKILQPIERMTVEYKDILNKEIQQKKKELKLMLLFDNQRTYSNLHSTLSHITPNIEKNKEAIHANLNNQILADWNQHKKKYKQLSPEDTLTLQAKLAYKCIEKTEQELHKILLQDERFKKYMQQLYSTCSYRK